MGRPWSVVETLEERHIEAVSRFSSGEPETDRWFHEHAHHQEALVRTHLCLDPGGDVLACFALKTSTVATPQLSSRMRHGTNEHEAAVLICQLALSSALQGQGNGLFLVGEALLKCLEVNAISPVRFVVIDALTDDLVSFYIKCGFSRVGQTRRLVMKTSFARKILIDCGYLQ